MYIILCNTSTGQYYDENWRISFWTYLTARLILDLLRASSLMLFEGAVVAIIKSDGGDYGLQKLFGTAGGIIFGPLAGMLFNIQNTRYGFS